MWTLYSKKERIQKFIGTGDTNYIYKNELDKACCQHGMAYGHSKKVLRDKALNIAKNSKYDGYQRRIASIVYKCFGKNSAGNGVNFACK